jgi:FtsH-binding integral membrane protein
LQLPAPGILLTLGGYFGLLFAVYKFRNGGWAVPAMVALLSAGLILFESSRIVNGGEINYVAATAGLYVSIFNLFTSLLSLFGIGSSDE